MTNTVSAITPVDQKPMVHLPNPSQGSDTFLSQAAEATLSKLSAMQAEFSRVTETGATRAAASPDVSAPAGTEGSQVQGLELAKSMEATVKSIHASTVVQQQLAQFVVASSVSSSFGRNLNMFLRGQ